MEALVQARPLILTLFFASLAAFGIGAFVITEAVLLVGGVIAHMALFLFVLTESFGSVSRKRSRASRNMARVFLVLSGVVVAGVVAGLLRALIAYVL